MKNIIKIVGTIIKVEPSKKSYGYTLKELSTNRESYFYNNWKLNIFPEQDYIFCLNIKPGQNKYYYLYQSHKLVEHQAKRQEQTNFQTNFYFYQQYTAQEIQRLNYLVDEQQKRIKLLEKLLNQKEKERLIETSQYQSQLKAKERIIKLNELELEKKISPYNSIEKLYYQKTKSPEQEKYLWELNNLFNFQNRNIF